MSRALVVLDAKDAVVDAAKRLGDLPEIDRTFWETFGLLRDRLADLAKAEAGSTEIPGLDEVTAKAAALIAGELPCGHGLADACEACVPADGGPR